MEPEWGSYFKRMLSFEAGLVEWGKRRPQLAHAVAPWMPQAARNGKTNGGLPQQCP